MNNYENNMCRCEVTSTTPKQPSSTLAETMAAAKCMGEEAIEFANIISSHLFGNSCEDGLRKTDGVCCKDVLENHCYTLQELLGTLHDIAVRLGSLKE